MKTNEEPNVRKEEVKAENKQRPMLQDEELEQVVGGAKYFWGYNRNADMELNLAQPSGTDFWDSKSLVENCPENPFMGGTESKC